MSALRPLLLVALGGFGAVFTGLWGRDIARKRARPAATGAGDLDHFSARAGFPSLAQTDIGFATNFFDFLGVATYSALALLRSARQEETVMSPHHA